VDGRSGILDEKGRAKVRRQKPIAELYQADAVPMRSGCVETFTEIGKGSNGLKMGKDPSGFGGYVVGSISIGMETYRFYENTALYESALLEIEGVGSCYTEDGFSPKLSRLEGHVDKPLFPEAHKMNGFIYATHPDIRFTHPETGEVIEWLEFHHSRKAHFLSYSAMDSLRSFPSTLLELIVESESIAVDLSLVDAIYKARGSWGRPKIESADGCPMEWEYGGEGGTSAEAVLTFLEEQGVFSLAPTSEV